MNNTILAALTGFASAAVMAGLSHFFILQRLRSEKLEALKSSYYEKQLASYQKFWSLLGPTSKYWSEDISIIVKKDDTWFLSIVNADKFFSEIRDFFYSEQGLFLSRDLRKKTFSLRKYVKNLLEQAGNEGQEFLQVNNKNRSEIQQCFHKIRIAVRSDLGLHDAVLPVSELELSEE